jgi:hypothetical protein
MVVPEQPLERVPLRVAWLCGPALFLEDPMGDLTGSRAKPAPRTIVSLSLRLAIPWRVGPPEPASASPAEDDAAMGNCSSAGAA